MTSQCATAARTRPPRLRADAVRNRERILAAARDAFVADGKDAPLDDIARQAGVGNATLYRHFPDRESLLYHVVLYVNDRITERAQRALEEESDPFEALRRTVLGSTDERIGALCPVIGVSIDPDDQRLTASRDRLLDVCGRLVERAQEAGQLRHDVGAGDLLIAISRLTRPLPGTRCSGGEILARRHLQIFLDGLRAPARSELPGTAAQVEDLEDEFI
ncbi:TetR/AcrR family transcriptional regulator [Streptomyces xiamenensis]